ncbi:TSC22 domain family protein 2-like isoform X2 [Stigmatopora argus]
MSKMPAKKKSCFQITSVTQAQVAAVGAADDTESLEDPDESRAAEDAAEEIHRESRAEHEPASDGGSSGELADVAAAAVAAAERSPHFSVLSVTPLGDFRNAAASPVVPQAAPQTPAANAPQAATAPGSGPPAATPATCTSRFRVIKLDHGTGEPFRRGRWMCAEYYEKESEGANRTAVGAAPEGDGGSAAETQSPADTSARQNSAARQQVPGQPQGVGNGLPHVSPVSPPSAPVPRLPAGQQPGGQNQSEYYPPPTGRATSPAPVPQTTATGSVAASVMAGGFPPGQYAAQLQSQGLHPALPAVQNAVVSPAAPRLQTAAASTAHGLPTAGIGQTEGGGVGKSDGAAARPLLPESLQLATPTVNSLFGIHIPVDGDEDSASGANIVAIDNKIEQAMDLVKSHLMYAVREEVEVLKEHIKELFERNSVLERENAVLKSLANSEQLSQLPAGPPNPQTPAQQQQQQQQPPPPPQQQQPPPPPSTQTPGQQQPPPAQPPPPSQPLPPPPQAPPPQTPPQPDDSQQQANVTSV